MKMNLTKIFQRKVNSSLFKSFLFLTCFFFASTLGLYAQTKTISGTIIDELKEPLIGVSVVVVGTTNGVMTDMDGKYAIEAQAGQVLEFSYVGMKVQRVTIGSQTVIDIVLEDNAIALNETVVIGYGSARKRDLTGSIVSIKSTDIADRPSSNPLASIQGKVAGVQVINTGRAGQDPEIRMRGTNSLNGYKPLYVVDGLFTDNINYINPSDIETMEILKDPSSLAIFGVRGANGVVILTTKRAKEGQTHVNINSSFGFKEVKDRISMANAAQFKELYDEQLVNQGVGPYDYTGWTADTNWQDLIFQTGFVTNNNVSIAGASDKNRFYLGLGYTKEEGNIKTEKYSKVTINLNSDYNVKEYLRFGFQVNGSRVLPPDGKDVGSAVLAAPIGPTHGIYDNPITGNKEELLHTLPSFQRGQVWNPLVQTDIRGAHNKSVNHRIAGNIYGEVDFLQHFKFKTTYSLDYEVQEARSYSPLVYIYNPDLADKKENLVDRETISQTKSTNMTAQSDYILTYDNKWGKHNLTAMGGITTNYREFSGLEASRYQLLNDIRISIPNDNPDKWWLQNLGINSMSNQNGTDVRQWRRFTMSYLLRGLYNYDNRYLFNASYRRDGSSVFRGVGNTWDNFYSAGAGWVASEEAFMSDIKEIDYLKFKASYGVLGSENTAGKYYPSYPGLTSSGSAVFGDNVIPGYALEYNPQPDLGWEKTYSWEAGFELNMFNQRLRIEPVYYNKTTKDIILQLESINGKSNSLENLAQVQNKGLELAISWSDKIGSSDFRYTIAGNLTTIDNEVLRIESSADAAKYDKMSRTMKGYPVAHFYGYKVIGVYQNNTDIAISPESMIGTVRPGDLKFADIDGDGEITTADRTMIGNPTPDLTYGLNFNLSYKNFDLGVDMMGVYGNDIYRDWGVSGTSQLNYHKDRLGRWNGEGTSNWEPILNPGRGINREHSSYYVEDGSFFRLRNIQLGYTFDASLLQKLHLKNLRVYGNIQNLKTWSKSSGYTPEIGGDSALSFGVDRGTYPMPVIYTFGLNLTF